MTAQVVWVDFRNRRVRGEAIDWLALAEGCEEQARRTKSQNVKDALLNVAKAYRAKVSFNARRYE